MNKIINHIFLFCILYFVCSASSYAQDSKEADPQTTRLNFEDELIEGNVSSPDLLLILKSKNANYGRLLKLRDNFLPEMNETKYDVLRGAQ